MLTELQKKAAQAIVNVFETGEPRGEYGKVTLLQGDTGHLTYGRSQTTLGSGNLHLLIKDYCETSGAEFAAALGSYVERLAARDTTLDHDMGLRSLLRDAAQDAVMCEVQDQFFDRIYWRPAVAAAEASGITAALGTGVVYDSRVHGSWRLIRHTTIGRHGAPGDIGEQAWIRRYVNERKEWLASHSNTLLHRTVYRMDAFHQLMDEDVWDLKLSFRVRGLLIDENTLLQTTPVRVSAHDENERTIRLQTPYMRGAEVEELQRALLKAGLTVAADGVFGPQTEEAVKRIQHERGLKVDGIVGPATRSALGLL